MDCESSILSEENRRLIRKLGALTTDQTAPMETVCWCGSSKTPDEVEDVEDMEEYPETDMMETVVDDQDDSNAQTVDKTNTVLVNLRPVMTRKPENYELLSSQTFQAEAALKGSEDPLTTLFSEGIAFVRLSYHRELSKPHLNGHHIQCVHDLLEKYTSWDTSIMTLQSKACREEMIDLMTTIMNQKSEMYDTLRQLYLAWNNIVSSGDAHVEKLKRCADEIIGEMQKEMLKITSNPEVTSINNNTSLGNLSEKYAKTMASLNRVQKVLGRRKELLRDGHLFVMQLAFVYEYMRQPIEDILKRLRNGKKPTNVAVITQPLEDMQDNTVTLAVHRARSLVLMDDRFKFALMSRLNLNVTNEIKILEFCPPRSGNVIEINTEKSVLDVIQQQDYVVFLVKLELFSDCAPVARALTKKTVVSPGVYILGSMRKAPIKT